LRCRKQGVEAWSPRAGSISWRDLPGAAAPADSPSLRLVQMRRQTERFTLLLLKGERSEELRRLPQPLYRYQDETSGVIDGALFAFVEATDAECLLLLEALRPTGAKEPAWRYALQRMTSLPLEAQFEGRQIWSVAGYWKNPRTPQDPYVEAFLGEYPTRPEH
jgi:hypothetical protein